MNCEYVKEHYGVPACVGRRVIIRGKKGIIAEDRGHYIGVNFDTDKVGVIYNAHPIDGVEYGEMGKVREMTDSINHPQHYKGKGLEVIEVIEAFELDFHRGNAVKYILRAGKKTEDMKEDIQKAIWYLNRFLEKNKS